MDRDQVIDFLSKLVEFDTSINPTHNQFPSRDCAKFIEEHAKNNGYEIISPQNCFYNNSSDYPLYPVLLVKRGKSKGKNILFLGHIDVVPVSEAEKSDWNYPAFEAHIKEDILYGRGSGDMKGGVTAFFSAFDSLEIKQGNLIIALSGDEEIGGLDTVPQMIEKLFEENLSPDYVINAEGSGTPFIVTKRRGGTQINFSFDLDYDTTNGKSVTKKFYSSLGDGSQSLHSLGFLGGFSIHAMISAAVFTQDKPISMVQSSSSKTNAVPKEVTIAYVEEDSSSLEKINYSKGISKLMHALASITSLHFPIVTSKYGSSICPNLLSINHDEGKGTVSFDIRSMLKDSDSHEHIAILIQEHFKSFELATTYNFILTIDPVNVDPDHEFAVLTDTIARKHGYYASGRGEKLGGASDTRFFTSLGIPGIEIGPIAGNAHGMNETVTISSILKLKSIYRELFQELSIRK